MWCRDLRAGGSLLSASPIRRPPSCAHERLAKQCNHSKLNVLVEWLWLCCNDGRDAATDRGLIRRPTIRQRLRLGDRSLNCAIQLFLLAQLDDVFVAREMIGFNNRHVQEMRDHAKASDFGQAA